MHTYIKPLEEVEAICKLNEAFFIKDTTINGTQIKIVNYRLASIGDFENTIMYKNANGEMVKSSPNFELRGLTYVKTDNGWKQHLLLNKFFNLNETKGSLGSWMYDDVKDKKIERIQNKEDGSVVSFIKIKDKTLAKSKTSFTSEQAVMANDVYNTNKNISKFVDYCISNNLNPIFELVGYENAIVLEYKEPYKLVLLQIREENGTYVNNLDYYKSKFGIEVTETYNLDLFKLVASKYTEESLKEVLDNNKFQSLDSFISFINKDNNTIDNHINLLQLLTISRDYIENVEGVIIQFEDGQIAKCKNTHYLDLHRLLGPDAFRENALIESIVGNTIDDIIARLPEGIKRERVLKITELVTTKFNHLVVEYKELRRQFFQDYKEDRKKFSIRYSKHKLFTAVMRGLNASFRDIEKFAEKGVNEYILNKTKHLEKAKKWIRELEEGK